MTKLQDDILLIYNSLVEFSKITLEGVFQIPIKVYYDKSSNSLCFEQKGKKIFLTVPNYYSMYLKNLKESYLLPKDYDYVMATLSSLVSSGELIKDRVCVSPQKYGFNIYSADVKLLSEGTRLIGEVRFVSGNSWLFKMYVKFKYRKLI